MPKTVLRPLLLLDAVEVLIVVLGRSQELLHGGLGGLRKFARELAILAPEFLRLILLRHVPFPSHHSTFHLAQRQGWI